jgi:hypothetical protein
MDDRGPICLTCADLEQLVFLPAGDAALTRRARRGSRLTAVVVRFSRARRRYERHGILVEEEAIVRAEEECLADEEARARRRERDEARRAVEDVALREALIREIARIFPGCPSERAASIARHTSVRSSGRVGRSAAGRALDPEAITQAVIASIRHEDTRYDALLMAGESRALARDRVRPQIEAILATWRMVPVSNGIDEARRKPRERRDSNPRPPA